MAARDWPLGSIMMAGHRVSAHTIRCSEPLCRNSTDMPDRGERRIPSDLIEKRFRKRGWFVGANDKLDICPECIAKKNAQRRSRRSKVPVLTVVPIEESPMTNASAAPNDGPAEMTNDDRRIIFAKLNEVYESKDVGYAAPWTDKKVAEALGCPLAWVAQTRDAFFGPARDNSEIRAILAQIEEKRAMADRALDEAKRLREDAAKLIQRANTINALVTKLEASVGALADRAEQIKRAVA